MAFTESLTVRILGDSSALRSDLEQVIDQIEGLEERISGISDMGGQLGRNLASVAQAVRPLQQVSQWLSRVLEQVRALNQSTVNVNVQPALQSLRQLMATAAAAAATLRTLAIGPSLPIQPRLPLAPFAPGAPAPIRGMATGGLVAGPPGLDRVPAMLSAGEFVLSQAAVQTLGTALLDDLNARSPSIPSDRAALMAVPPVVHLNEPPLTAPSVVPADQPRLGAQGESRHNFADPVVTSRADSPKPSPQLALPGPTMISHSNPHTETHTTHNHFGGITIQVREAIDVNHLVRDLRLQGIQLRNRRG